ncbi:MAG: tetratricopeptide repeat protein [Planctomycetota bacterium]
MNSLSVQTLRLLQFNRVPRFLALLALVGFAAASQVSVGRAAEIEFAHRLFRDQRYQLAAEEYEAVLASKPPKAVATEARFYLAEARLQLGKEEQALAEYSQLAKLDASDNPHARMTLFRIAQLRHRQNALDQVLPLVRQFLEEYPNDPLRPYVECMRGDAAASAGQFDEARRAYESALNSNPEAALRPNILFGQARLAEREGNAAEAAKRFEQIANLPDQPFADDARFAVGVLAFQDRRFDEAIASFKRLIADFPSSSLLPAAFLNQGLCLLQQERFVEASSLLSDAAKRFPDDRQVADMKYHAAVAEFRAGQFRTAKEQLVSLLESQPGFEKGSQGWYYVCLAAKECSEPAVALAAHAQLASNAKSKEWRDRAAVVAAEALLATPSVEKRGETLANLQAATEDPAARLRLSYYAAVLAMDEKRYADAQRELETLLLAKPSGELARESSYLLGMALLRQRQWAKAVSPLDQYLRTEPTDVHPLSPSTLAAMRGLGEALSETEETDANHEVMTRLIEFAAPRPEGPEILAAFADRLADAGRHAPAVAIHQRLSMLEQTVAAKSKALIAWGWSLYELEQYSAAQEKFSSAADLADPNPAHSVEARYMAGVCAQKEKDTAVAIECFEKVLNESGGSEWSLDAGQRLADLLIANKRLEEADKVYATMAQQIGDAPAMARVLYDRGWLALERDNKDQAQECFKQLVVKFPSSEWSAESTLKLAELSYEKGDFQASFEHASGPAPNSADATVASRLLYRRGLAAKSLGKLDEARAAFEKLSQEHAKDRLAPIAEFWLAEMDYDAGNAEAALAGFRKVLDQKDAEKYHATSRLRIAQALVLLKRSAEAETAAEELAESSPDNSIAKEANYTLGRALVLQAKFDDARAAFEKVAGEDRSEIAAKSRFMIAESFFHQRRFEEALKNFLKVELLYPLPQWQSLALLEAGKCHEQMGQPAEAIIDYRKLLERFPESSSASMAKERLAALESSRKE